MQEDDAEHEESNHHGEGAGVVGVRRGDEPFVLRVLEGPHRHLAWGESRPVSPAPGHPSLRSDSSPPPYLGRGVEVGVTQPVVIHFELEHTVDVRQLEPHAVFAA